MLNGKVYVVTSLDLVNAVNRNSKILAFNPFIAQLGKRITGHDEATSRVVQHNLNGEEGPGYVTEIHDGTVSSLAPGDALDRMTNAMMREASLYLDDLQSNTVIELFTWIRHTITLASTRAIYGSKNVFTHDESLVTAFWYIQKIEDSKMTTLTESREFDHDLNPLIIDILPSLLAPKGDRARSKLGLAFQRYFKEFDSQQNHCAAIAETRYFINQKYGISTWNQGRLEVGVLLGILANTIPSIFYLLIHIYSDPSLLQDIRTEIESTSVQCFSDPGRRRLRINTMRKQCTLLLSTFQELLRVHALGSSVRYVREDIVLNEKYLLKKGMVVQMPMAYLHTDSSSWGADVGDFQPRRFLKPKANATAYRPFGGGASLCPGRHFVTLEAMLIAAYMVLIFDMSPCTGKWEIPRQKQESMATNVFPPAEDIAVEIKKRRGYEEVSWEFDMS